MNLGPPPWSRGRETPGLNAKARARIERATSVTARPTDRAYLDAHAVRRLASLPEMRELAALVSDDLLPRGDA